MEFLVLLLCHLRKDKRGSLRLCGSCVLDRISNVLTNFASSCRSAVEMKKKRKLQYYVFRIKYFLCVYVYVRVGFGINI